MSENNQSRSSVSYKNVGLAIGLVFGGVIGWIIGDPFVYAGGCMVLGFAIGAALDARRH